MEQSNVSLVIAIDGPVASGKSTVGKRVADALGCIFVDTGLMYRAVAFLSSELDVDPSDARALKDLAEGMEIVVNGTQVVVDGDEIGGHLRKRSVESRVSQISAIPDVRKILVAKQQAMAARGKIVMVGRDIGTAVLPHAPFKIYLDASEEERASRRFLELAETNRQVQQQDVTNDLKERDTIDSQRKASPLRPAPPKSVSTAPAPNNQTKFAHVSDAHCQRVIVCRRPFGQPRIKQHRTRQTARTLAQLAPTAEPPAQSSDAALSRVPHSWPQAENTPPPYCQRFAAREKIMSKPAPPFDTAQTS